MLALSRCMSSRNVAGAAFASHSIDSNTSASANNGGGDGRCDGDGDEDEDAGGGDEDDDIGSQFVMRAFSDLSVRDIVVDEVCVDDDGGFGDFGDSGACEHASGVVAGGDDRDRESTLAPREGMAAAARSAAVQLSRFIACGERIRMAVWNDVLCPELNVWCERMTGPPGRSSVCMVLARTSSAITASFVRDATIRHIHTRSDPTAADGRDQERKRSTPGPDLASSSDLDSAASRPSSSSCLAPPSSLTVDVFVGVGTNWDAAQLYKVVVIS